MSNETKLTARVGKFAHAIDAVAYEVSLAGCDEEHGATDLPGQQWCGLLRGWRTDGSMADLSATARIENALTAADLDYMRAHSAGCIVREDSDGHCVVEWFADPAKRDARWEELTQ